MSKTNLGLVEFCKQAVDKTGYVYGTLGQVCTKDLLDQCAKRYPANNLAGGTMRKVGNKWLGRRVTDCIGLLKYYMFSDAYGQNPVYNSRYDLSANGAYNQATVKGPMSSMPDVPGICLHMNGHIGYYIGNGDVIEARGTVYGVVKTRLSERPWIAWFKSPWFTYIQAPTVATKCDTTKDFSIGQGKSYIAKVTCATTPNFCVGNTNIFHCELMSNSGNDYLYKLTAVGNVGEAAGIYLDDKRICMATIVNDHMVSDTTHDFSLKQGTEYQFKITGPNKPVFTAGTAGVLTVNFAGQKEDDYFFKVKAIGASGTGTGMYINGTKTVVVTVS